ncbi:cysteine desulfurase (tRNA sulfurtransferase), PLP-dependent [Syntrophobacter sp. SbD1]|nr:cysteine desulfurase (tRNA sulfurtransferase), PLP-dependent [Syntrophobacter sp. SbD1]
MSGSYLDHASASPVRKEVIEAMLPYFDQLFANPSTVYDLGSRIKLTLEEQRAKVANLIGANAENVIFTSSGAEANNLAIKGVALGRQKKGRHIIVSAIEHHSVLNSARFLERLDFEVTFLPVDNHGVVAPERLQKAINAETVLVSIMHANNEIGTLQSISELASICREKGVIFHTDAVASTGNVKVDVNELNVDLLSLSGVSVGAPKGVGALYFREKIRLMPLIHGGIQENGRRAGTENIPGIVGLGKASELAMEELPEKTVHVRKLRDLLVNGVLERVPKVRFTGHPQNRLPGHASFCFEAIEGESLIFMLAREGIYVNTGSACASKALKTSPVLVAIGVPAVVAQGSAVFTIDKTNTVEEIMYVLEKLPTAVDRLRMLSPVWGREAPVYGKETCA